MQETTLWRLAFNAKHAAQQSIVSLKAQIENARRRADTQPSRPLSEWINEVYENGAGIDIDVARGEVLELKAYLQTAQRAWARFETYQPIRKGARQCPHCWVADGVQTDLIVYGTAPETFLKCLECGENLSVDIAPGVKPLTAVN